MNICFPGSSKPCIYVHVDIFQHSLASEKQISYYTPDIFQEVFAADWPLCRTHRKKLTTCAPNSVVHWTKKVHFSFAFFFLIFRSLRFTLTAYGDSQARGLIGAVATGLCQSHRNARSEPRLQPTPQLTATPDP